jgi:hypothetical protein
MKTADLCVPVILYTADNYTTAFAVQPHRHRKRQGAITGPRESVMTTKETNRWKRYQHDKPVALHTYGRCYEIVSLPPVRWEKFVFRPPTRPGRFEGRSSLTLNTCMGRKRGFPVLLSLLFYF